MTRRLTRAGKVPAENHPQVAELLVGVAAGGESARAEDEAPEPGETATVEVSHVAEKLNPAVQFRMERVPEYFLANGSIDLSFKISDQSSERLSV